MTIPDLAPVIPGSGDVALIAAESKLSPMRIEVAVGTRCGHTIKLETLVTTRAFDFLMAESERQARFSMVKLDRVPQGAPTLSGVALATVAIHVTVRIVLILRSDRRRETERHYRDQDHQAPARTPV